MAATRGSSFGLLSSIRCLWMKTGNKAIYSPYERPPFPILVDCPTANDVWNELRMSDFVMGGAVYGFGMLSGWHASRSFNMLMQRVVVYHGVSHMFGVFGLSLMIVLPHRRLTGYWDNGCRWKKPEDRLNKWDCTSHFEKATGWEAYRINQKE